MIEEECRKQGIDGNIEYTLESGNEEDEEQYLVPHSVSILLSIFPLRWL